MKGLCIHVYTHIRVYTHIHVHTLCTYKHSQVTFLLQEHVSMTLATHDCSCKCKRQEGMLFRSSLGRARIVWELRNLS